MAAGRAGAPVRLPGSDLAAAGVPGTDRLLHGLPSHDSVSPAGTSACLYRHAVPALYPGRGCLYQRQRKFLLCAGPDLRPGVSLPHGEEEGHDDLRGGGAAAQGCPVEAGRLLCRLRGLPESDAVRRHYPAAGADHRRLYRRVGPDFPADRPAAGAAESRHLHTGGGGDPDPRLSSERTAQLLYRSAGRADLGIYFCCFPCAAPLDSLHLLSGNHHGEAGH